MAQQTVTLQPNESKIISFQAIPTEARAYQVSVNGLTGSFVAMTTPPQPPPEEVSPSNPIVGLVPETVVSGGEFPVTIWFWLEQKPAVGYLIDVKMDNQYWGSGYISLVYGTYIGKPLPLDHTGVYSYTGKMKAIGTGPYSASTPKPPGIYPIYSSCKENLFVGNSSYQFVAWKWRKVVIGEIEVTAV